MLLLGLALSGLLESVTHGQALPPIGLPSSEKAPQWFFNLKLGTKQSVYNSVSGSLEVVLDVGRSISGNLYVVLPLQFSFSQVSIATDNTRLNGAGTAIVIPIGLEYDISLLDGSVFLTPRILAGYAWSSSRVSGLTSTGAVETLFRSHSAVVIPELGLKWVIRRRINLGADVLSMPIVISDSGVGVAYRVLFYLGLSF